jgi:type IV pilus assembly protein PilO
VTNFQGFGSRSSAWLKPERLVLLLPIAVGAALLALLVLVGYPPLLLQLQQRRQVIAQLESQQALLPLLRSQIHVSELQLQRKQQQQERLLTLVAGTGQLRTWLASLNDVAAATGVAVTLLEPGPLEIYTPPPPPPPEEQPPGAAPVQMAAPADPLLAPDLQKRSAQITVRGTFPALRRFLQQLETLQVVAIASDLELKAEATPTQQAQQQIAKASGTTELKLKLSAYGRAPAKR